MQDQPCPEAVRRPGTAQPPIAPDRDFIYRVLRDGGDTLRQCVQCATCSAVCNLTAQDSPLPRKEMLWAQWGLKHRLIGDIDLWLCHECHDCTLRCPRGARPGDVMAALRRECIAHFTVPQFVGRAATRPASLWVFAVFSTALLCLGAVIWNGAGASAYELAHRGERIIIPFWTKLPHGFLATLFAFVVMFDVLVFGLSLSNFCKALCRSEPLPPNTTKLGLFAILRRIMWHEDFAMCVHEVRRRVSHTLVFYAMLALMLVDLWVITARYNPLRSGLVYPMGFADPWKLLANLAGLALFAGCVLMSVDRLKRPSRSAPVVSMRGTYSDWLPLWLLLVVTATGFLTEALHFARLDDLRHVAYVVHLVSTLTLLLLLPYSKLAHMAFRTVALIVASHHGRVSVALPNRNRSGS